MKVKPPFKYKKKNGWLTLYDPKGRFLEAVRLDGACWIRVERVLA